MQTPSILQKYKESVTILASNYNLNEARTLARLIAERVTGMGINEILINPQLLLSPSQVLLLDTYIDELKLHKPIQYILGETEFFGISLKVDPSVLIPRPETEELVHWIVSDWQHTSPNILDMGTGSGAIAIALAKNLPAANVFALDISLQAITVAQENAINSFVNIHFMQHDMLQLPTHIKGAPFDLVVSNPPYVRNSEKELMDANVLEFEPDGALFVPDDNPLLFYEAIAKFAQLHLKPNGTIYCEINEAFGSQTETLFKEHGYSNVEVRKDINGKERMLKARKGD